MRRASRSRSLRELSREAHQTLDVEVHSEARVSFGLAAAAASYRQPWRLRRGY